MPMCGNVKSLHQPGAGERLTFGGDLRSSLVTAYLARHGELGDECERGHRGSAGAFPCRTRIAGGSSLRAEEM